MIKKSSNNPLARDTFICSVCMTTTFSAEHCVPIPQLDPINECLSLAEYNVEQISQFKDQHNLDEVWNGLLPDLDGFKEACSELRERFKQVIKQNQWWNLVHLHSDARMFLNRIFDSDIMKYYNRQFQSRSFHDSKRGSSLREGDTQIFLRAKVAELKKNQISLQKKLDKSTQEAERRTAQVKTLLQEKVKLDQEFRDLKISTEQKIIDSQAKIQELGKMIETKNNENSQQTAQLEELKNQISFLEMTLEDSTSTITHAELKEIHNLITSSSFIFNRSSDLILKLNKWSDQTLLKALQLRTLPSLNQLYIDYIGSFDNPSVISKFLINAVRPYISSLREFVVINRKMPCIHASSFIRGFKNIFEQTSNFIGLYRFKISKEEFEALVIAGRHCKEVKFNKCEIVTDEQVEFGDELGDSSFIKIDFYKCGGSAYSKWKDNGFKRLHNIVKGLAKVSQLKERKILLGLSECDLTKDEAQTILIENGFTAATIQGI
ncbi:unnamed protein product [Moneuplotes crassus]|uniref:Uncharacterized protein n=1 Tax=Euplotes crassus TaxID=5936 RepID=A0AAD2DCM2_EUPCR|nr:unnamed protein product [Moneuplotes crassus]